MGSSSDDQIIGYKYYVGMHLAACHGPVDSVLKIRAGEVDIWETPITSSQQVYINKPGAFGGEEREGGVQGYVDVAFGDSSQAANDYLQTHLTVDKTPGYRGLLGFILRQVYVAALNPYIKPWSFYVKRCGGAAVGDDMNPAQILYECLTNTEWGMGYPAGDIGDSFAAAKTTLSSESFGLSLLWERSATIESFITEVLRHIEGVLYTDIFTGKIEMKLIRPDYVLGNLMTLDESNVIEVQSYSRRSQAELINTITLKYADGPTDKQQALTVHNLGLIQAQQQIINEDADYPGISNAALASKVAARDLRSMTAELSTVVLTANREALSLRLGDAFKFSWDDYGVVEEVMRVSYIDYGTLQDGKITVHATQDVWGTATAVYADVPATGWTDPVSAPAAAPNRLLWEATYWELVKLFGETATVWSEIDALMGRLMVAARRPSSDALNYRLKTKAAGGTYTDRGVFAFCPTATLASGIDKTQTALSLSGMVDVDLVETGTFAMIEDEVVAIDSIDAAAGTATITRAVLDTTPAEHSSGARIWFADTWKARDNVDYAGGETAYAKCMPITGKGELAEASAPEDTLELDARYIRPYPPGKFLLNTESYPDYITGALAVAWAHRDRLQQTAGFIAQSEASIGPEAGTTYTLKIYGEDGGLLRTASGLSGASYDYALATEISDSAPLGRPNDELRVVLDAQRDGYDSWQAHEHTVECRGYGMLYGAYYGE